jgi:hypothetical protein
MWAALVISRDRSFLLYMTSPREAGIARVSSSLLRTEHLKSHGESITLLMVLNTTNSFREMYEVGAEMGGVYGMGRRGIRLASW